MTPHQITELANRLENLDIQIAEAERTEDAERFELVFSLAQDVAEAIERLPILGNFEERMAAIRAKARAALWCLGSDDLRQAETRDERLIGQVLAGLTR